MVLLLLVMLLLGQLLLIRGLVAVSVAAGVDVRVHLLADDGCVDPGCVAPWWCGCLAVCSCPLMAPRPLV